MRLSRGACEPGIGKGHGTGGGVVEVTNQKKADDKRSGERGKGAALFRNDKGSSRQNEQMAGIKRGVNMYGVGVKNDRRGGEPC